MSNLSDFMATVSSMSFVFNINDRLVQENNFIHKPMTDVEQS